MIDPTWINAAASWGSAILALALALGLREWIHRPRVHLILHGQQRPGEFGDRVVTKRVGTGRTTAFVRLRLVNRGRSTARRVGIRVLRIHSWDEDCRQWRRVRPELDGRLLEPSNQLSDEAGTVDVFPHSDRIIDLVSVGGGLDDDGPSPVIVEIGQPRPPTRLTPSAPESGGSSWSSAPTTSTPSGISSPFPSMGTGPSWTARGSGTTCASTARPGSPATPDGIPARRSGATGRLSRVR